VSGRAYWEGMQSTGPSIASDEARAPITPDAVRAAELQLSESAARIRARHLLVAYGWAHSCRECGRVDLSDDEAAYGHDCEA
jgi:hypothetical protein